MNSRYAAPVAGVAAAMMLLVACGDDGPTNLANGEDVDLVGSGPIADQTMDIVAQEDDGQVTGKARFNSIEVTFECADTDTDGLVILGGNVTAPSADGSPAVGELMAVLIREGDPDRLTVWIEGDDDDHGSCRGLLDAIPAEERRADSSSLVEVQDGDDIQTG
jgi:hypothetical protein